MNLLKSLTRSEWPTISLDQYISLLNVNGNLYGLSGLNQTLRGTTEEIDSTFLGLVDQAYKRNGIVFAAMAARFLLFSGIRFQYQQMNGPKVVRSFGDRSLSILERPWGIGSTTSDLLGQMMVYNDTAGNAFVVKRSGGRLVVPRPDWVTIVLGSMKDPEIDAADLDAEFLGILYHPGGRGSGRQAEKIDRKFVAHFAPYPDPLAKFRGMAWLTPIIREIAGDSAATSHKLTFFENAATPNMVVSLDKDIALTAYNEWVDAFEENEPTGWDAYKTIYLGAGAKVEVVGSDLHQIDFKVTQGAGETRIAAASGIHPVILGLSEGLAGSSLNAGNFQSARRLTADKTMYPLWMNLCGSMEPLVAPLADQVRLWYDTGDVPFLREDRKDAAEIEQVKATTINTYITAGFTPESAVLAAAAEDPTLLKHTGLVSVQLQKPGTESTPADAAGRALAALVAPHLLPPGTNGS